MDEEVGLINRLRSRASAQERKFIINQLANTPSLTALEELIKVTKRSRKRWSTLRRFSADDQLSALSALGKTRSRTALSYLRGLIEKENPIVSEYGVYQGIDLWFTGFDVVFSFPHAPRSIRRLLEIQFAITDGDYQSSSAAIKIAKSRLLKENTCYQIIIQSIKELETAIPRD